MMELLQLWVYAGMPCSPPRCLNLCCLCVLRGACKCTGLGTCCDMLQGMSLLPSHCRPPCSVCWSTGVDRMVLLCVRFLRSGLALWTCLGTAGWSSGGKFALVSLASLPGTGKKRNLLMAALVGVLSLHGFLAKAWGAWWRQLQLQSCSLACILGVCGMCGVLGGVVFRKSASVLDTHAWPRNEACYCVCSTVVLNLSPYAYCGRLSKMLVLFAAPPL